MNTIHTIEHEHGYLLQSKVNGIELSVDIDRRERFFTVWNVIEDKPVATITRPRVLDRRGQWEASATDGSLISKAIGPRLAFRAVINHLALLNDLEPDVDMFGDSPSKLVE